MPNTLVRYPTSRKRLIHVGRSGGRVWMPLRWTPRLCGYRPVARLNRAGMHTGAVVMQVENVVPAAASASRFGVCAQWLARPRLSARCWSVRMNNTFGRTHGLRTTVIAGPVAYVGQMTSPLHLKLFGAFRSGSNYTRALLELNYDVRVLSGSGGFKHAPVPAVFEAESFRPFPWPILAAVKDPYAWLASMWRYVNDVGGRHTIHGETWAAFLTEPLVVFQGNIDGFPKFRFANPVDYWNAINYNLVTLPEDSRRIVRYEDVLADPEGECRADRAPVRAGAHGGGVRIRDATGPQHGRP